MFTTGLPTYVPSLFVTNGVNGGFVNFSSQSEVPPLPTGGATIYADSNNDLVIDGPRGFSATLSRELLTKSQVYSLPDLSGSLVLLGEGTNTILGNESMTQITTGGNNVSIGYNSGNDVTSGSGNVIVGSDAAAAMVSTNDCVIVGYGAGATNVNDGLVAVGAGAAASCVDASGVTAIGTGAGQNNTVDGLTAVGYNSLNAVTTGLNNTAIGSSSGLALTTGSNNICVGANSANGATDATAVSNIYIGTGTTTSESISNSIIMGTDASSSVSNEFMLPLIKHFNLPLLSTDTVGTGTLLQIGGTNADYVVASGGTYNSVAAIDTAITALQNDIIVSGTNMAIGGESFGATVTGADCTATGDGALKSLTGGSWNTAFGYNALGSTTTNSSNVAFGDSALGSCLGSNNTAVGSSALHELTTGISNVGIGAEAGASLTTGSNNVCIGTSSNVYSDACSGAIILGASATNTASDQLYISPTITSFNISGLAASTGTGAGTILEFDSTGNILPSAGTYNSVSKIDSAIGAAGGICPLDSSTQVSPTYLPPATPTTLGVMYGAPPINTTDSSFSLGDSQAPGIWSIAIGNNVLTSAEGSTVSNIAVGSNNLENLTVGGYNTAIGQNSSTSITTGSYNVTLGCQAGNRGFVTGSNNIAIGYNSATSTNDAAVSDNIYIGPNTATGATGVSNSIMIGSGATSSVSNEFMIGNIDHLNIPSLTTSADGTGVLLQWGGTDAGWVQASGGTYNSVSKIDNAIGAANGICPLDSSTQVSPTYLPSATPTTLGVLYGTPPTPSYVNSSLSLGANANAAGTWSIAIGNDVLTSAEGSTQCNVAIGSYNLKNLTTGQYNTAIGQGSLNNLTTGSSNVALGYEAGGGYSTTDGIQSGSNNIAIGNFAASGTSDGSCSNNIYIGPSTMASASGISNSIIMGSDATSGVSNEFMIGNIDHLNIPSLTTSADGTGILLQWGGADAGWVQASGGTYNSVSKIDTVIADLQADIIIAGTNMAIGGESFGTGVTGGDCTATGDGALKALTGGSYNTAFGYNALGSTTTNSSNVAVGDTALGSCLSDYNTAVGSSALHELTSGESNVGCGLEAGSGVTTGSNNICIGANSASSSTDAAASGNIYIGSGAVTNATTSNAIIMGQGAVCGVSGEFNLPHIVHFYVPSLTTDTVGTGTLLQWGGNNADFILASGGTHNTVATIDEAFTQVENRQADVSYLSDYPADPTGTNDSTTAIQDAINAGKPIVQLGAGTYLITGTLTIPSGTTLRGYGQAATTLEKTTASTGDIIDILGTTSTNTNITIRDINFNANSIANAISTQYVSKFTVENCSFINVAAGSNAISIASAVTTDTTILNTNCLVSNCIYQTTVGSTFVYLTNAQDVIIIDCNCESTTTTAAGNGVVMAQLCSSVQVVRCLFYAMVAGINIALSCNGIRIENCDFPNISGTVSGTTNTGIQTGLAAVNTALTATTINNLIITDCTTNWVYGTAVELNSCTGAVVADTSISYSSDESLMITNCSYTTVRGCTFYNNAQGTADSAPAYNGGIHIYGPVSPYTWIVDCQFYDNQTTPTQDIPIGISYTTATTYSDIFVINCNLQSYNGASSIALVDLATIGTDVWCVNCTNVTGLPAGVLNGGPTEYEYVANKGVANGYCPLNSSSLVPVSNLPPATPTAIGAVYGVSIASGNGQYNVGYGYGALNSTSSGYQNIGIGNGTLSSLVNGSANAGIGAESLNACTSGSYNVAMGPGGLQVVTTGSSNIGVGYQSGYGITTGGSNICIGYQSGTTITTTNDNIIIGTSANVYSDACSGAIVLGASAINTASDQLYIAPTITSFNISGLAASTGTGAGTILEFDSTGNILPSAGTYNSVSKIDSAIGAASGICPLDSSTQVSPTYLPPATPTTLGAMYGTPPILTNITSSLSLGANAFAIGTWSIAIGNNVLTKVDSSTIGNVAVGSLNLQNATTGQYNVAIGQGSMVNLTTGTSNVGLGYQAGGGLNSDNGFLTGNYNIAIGYYAASGTYDAAVSDNIYIGPNTATGATGVSNSIMLGSGATSSVSNEFMISNIDHLNIPSLTTSTDGTGTLLQWGGADAGWVQASGGTYNSVSKIESAFANVQSDIASMGTIYTWDGASGTATVLADATYSTNTILTSDLVTNTLTIDSGIVLSTAGYRIICQQLVLNGTIDNSGRAGSPGGTTSAINGDATPATSFGGGTDGASSTDGVGASAPPIPGWTFLTYTSYTAGSGASGAGGSSSAATYPSYMPYSSPYSYTLTNPTGGLLWSGPGGGAGAGDGTNYGGAGGGGGGVISISAIIISGSGGVISAVGGAGGAATAGDTGGGSGGGGGFIMLHTRQNPQTFTFTASVAGGAGGVGYGTGTAGSAGPSGQIIIINPA